MIRDEWPGASEGPDGIGAGPGGVSAGAGGVGAGAGGISAGAGGVGAGAIRAVIFDLDGTLANTLPLCIRAFRQAVEPLTLRKLSDEEIIATFGPSEEGTILTLAPEHYEQGVVNYLQFYEDLHDMCPVAFAGVAELLQQLKERGVRLGMVTGKGKHSTAISLRRLGLTDFFEYIETGEPTGPVKAAKIGLLLDRWHDLDKSEVIYVGDAPSDITASRQAGIAVVAAAWAETAEPDRLLALHPDVIFYSINDLSRWLQERR